MDIFPLDTLCTAVASVPISTSNGLISVSVSIGAYHVCHPSQWEDDLRCADHALYRAKKEGRNCVRWHMTD
ncbi:GGDEF domain-containing protein [Halomonas sp. HAL1]|uniref:GGDEF domain-containing protein n=1 Tax=Halomonas sp. HAL1 TaxID=550984 RepID=UPI003FCE2D67